MAGAVITASSLGRTYSSYELDKFQTCPALWDYSKRWELPEDNWSVSLHLGGAVAVGLSVYRQTGSLRDAQRAALREMDKRYEQNDEWTIVGVMKHVHNAMELGISADLGIHTIISADQQKYGRCRPDLVGRTVEGRLRIWDDKVKLKLDPKYIDSALDEYRHSNQLYEYAWEVGRHYSELVEMVGVNLIILSPSPRVVPYAFKITQEAINYWAEGATDDFLEMHFIETGVARARTRWTSCITKYNKPGSFEKALCPMHSLCHDLHGDESKAEAFYERK